MGLFDKKYCDVCGEKIKFLGNRKLEDGNLCKDCAEKLSPWFSDRRRSTVESIKAQLQDREANRAKVAAFSATRTLGEGTLLCIDEEKRQFLVRRYGESLDNNPDVLSLSQVKDCQVQVEQDKDEEKTRGEDGSMVSYDPPRYTYQYTFHLSIQVDHPWFDEMRFRVNRSPVEIQTGLPIKLSGGLSASNLFTPDRPDTDRSQEYQRYLDMAEDMRKALLAKPKEQPQAPAWLAPERPRLKVQCPACLAVSYPDEKGCCPYCGLQLF